ncbi:hypothetical protein LTR92_010990 [Exophiala xenobiotica]|nr:hypothetical protein LTR92_010990 [Exophiala xenobiotica]KAK5425647.1 hypothetical protein LTR34_010930 [Exophiala xenobiotica]KAK5527928.1 hypothetical protein LTR23_011158 [Chaetothyriales sp. CCFEE 6169]
MQENIHFPSYPSSSHNFLKKLAKQTNGCQLENGAIHQDLDIAVVGAGVGGLSAAIALKKAGFDVTVYEAASALGEYRKIGAGIQVPPNSSRILHSWGLEETLNKKAVKPEGVYWRRWQNGKVIGNSRFNPEFSKWFGAPYYVIHRAHLHEVLHDRAVELGVPIELNWRVVKYDLDAGSLTRGDGATIHADLIVAADGIRSPARLTLLGESCNKLVSCGLAAYRAAIPMKAILADPEISWVAESGSVELWVGHNAHAMTYSISKGELFNMVLTHPETDEPGTWDQSNALAEMKAFYDGWDPVLTKLLNLVTSTQKWPIQQIDIPEDWISPSGKVALLGDAAHAMLPNMALGAAMAVEDAATLAECLKVHPGKDSLPKALDLYQKIRIPRAEAVQEASDLHGFILHYPDGPLQEARDAAMRAEVEGIHFPESPNQWSDPMTQQFCYNYDAIDQVYQALRDTPKKQSSAHKHYSAVWNS